MPRDSTGNLYNSADIRHNFMPIYCFRGNHDGLKLAVSDLPETSCACAGACIQEVSGKSDKD